MLAVWGLRPTHPPGCCYNGNPRHRNWFKWLLRTFPISSEVVPFPGIRVCWVSKLTNGKSNWKPAETCRNLPKPIWGFPDSAVEPLWLKLWAANVSCCRNRSASCSHNTSTTELGSWHLKTYQKTVVIWPNPIDLDGIGGPYWLSSQPPEPGPRHAILQELWPEHNVDGKILQAKQIQGFQLTCGSFSLLLFAIFTSVQSHRPFPYGTIVRHLQIMLITNFHWLPLSFLGFHQLSRNSISSCSHLRTSLILNEVLHATGGGIGRLAPEWCQNFSNAGHEHLLVQELTCMCIYVRACNR